MAPHYVTAVRYVTTNSLVFWAIQS